MSSLSSFPWSFTPADITLITLQQAARLLHLHIQACLHNPFKVILSLAAKANGCKKQDVYTYFKFFPQKINKFNLIYYLGRSYSASLAALKATILQASDAIYGAVPDWLGLRLLESI